MKISLYCGSELADFNERFNVLFSIGDIRNMAMGNNNKSYTLKLPLTKTNKKLVKFINQVDVKSEQSAIWRLYLGELLIIQGIAKITDTDDYFVSMIISSDDWIDALSNRRMSDLDLSAYNHTYNSANVIASWSAAYPFYRYPMINFGALFSAEYGATPDWTANDFIPMFRVLDLMTSILSPYTISSSWSALSDIRDLYILANEKKAPDSFIVGKGFERQVNDIGDNNVSDVFAASETKDITLADGNTDFNGNILDEGSDYDEADNWYVVPETGTYKFIFDAKSFSFLDIPMTINSQQMILAIKRTRGASTDTLVTETTNYTAANIFDNSVHSIESGYVYCEAGDKVFCTRYMTQNLTNTSGVAESITIYLDITATKFTTIWGVRNLYAGIGKTIVPDDLLPDISQIDFISAIKKIYNLQFFYDKMKRTIYIEPFDTFHSDTVVNLDSLISHESHPQETISANYSNTVRLKFKDDANDFAYNEWLKTSLSPGQKDIVLNSIYTEPGIDTKENLFSSVVMGINPVIGWYATQFPRILVEDFEDPPIKFNRLCNFNPRIVEWKGLTAGITWYMDGTSYATYPRIVGLDFNTIYTSYWQKFFHYVDKGKILTLKMKVTGAFLSQFYTVLSTSEDEGFRPTYSVTINGNLNYFLLQKITTDGEIAEVELILK